MNKTGRTSARTPDDRHPAKKFRFATACTALWILAIIGASLATTVAAQDYYVDEQGNYVEQQPEAEEPAFACAENGMNIQCTEFGSIKMEARRDVRGEPLDVSADIQLNTGYADSGARWVMFSVRNITDTGPSPITIGLNAFSTSNGDVVTTRVEQVKPSELNLWVDVLDLPVGIPIALDLRIGATDRGAFALETLVLAFDRGYAPVQDSDGNDASLFSFTLLGVNEETEATTDDGGGSLAKGNKLPGPGAIAVLGVLAIGAAIILRRRTP